MKHALPILLWLICSAPAAFPADAVQIQFPNADVSQLLDFYERLTGFHTIRNNRVIGQISIVISTVVTREKAVELIEDTLFSNGYCLIQTKPDTVEVFASGKTPGDRAVPVVTKPDDLPKGERIVSYVFKLKFRQPAEIAKLLEAQLSPYAYGFHTITQDNHSRSVIVTERTSTLREMIRLVAELDVAKKK